MKYASHSAMPQPHLRIFRRTASAIGFERFAALTGYPIWIILFGLVASHGIIVAFAVGLCLELAHALIVLEVHIRSSRKYEDLTGVRDVMRYIKSPMREKRRNSSIALVLWQVEQLTKSVLKRTLGSYWLMILVGSNVYFGTDYVTLILKREDDTRREVFFRVMLPAGIASMTFGTGVAWGTIQGVWLAATLWEWL